MVLSRLNRLSPHLVAMTGCRRVEAGAFLYRRGDPALNVFTVERGRLCLYSTTSEGSAVPFYTVYPGECISEAALFADAYCGDVRAEVPSRVRVFPKMALHEAMREDPELAEEFMASQAARFRAISIRLELRHLRSARERILQYFREMARMPSESFVVDRPMKGIAEDLGLSHESFYRTVAQLVKEGALKKEKRVIRIRSSSTAASANEAA